MNPKPCWFWTEAGGGSWNLGIVHAFMPGEAVVTAGRLDAPGGKYGEGQPKMVPFKFLSLGEKKPDKGPGQ